MSYDLFFRPRHVLPTRAEFAAYFAERAGYTIKTAQAWYQNDDTGVYFSFDYCAPGDDGEREDADRVPLAFNLNYFRPHFFGLEAAPEIEAFIRRFGLEVDDPQTDGMGEGPFTMEGFLRGWNSGNRLAYRAVLSSQDRPEVFVYPTDGLERVWRWNHRRRSLQEEVGDALFVPKLIFTKDGPRACTAIVWPDACPIYMPRSDLVFLLRDELSTDQSVDDSDEIVIVKWEQVAPLLSDFPERRGDVPYYHLDYRVPPDRIAEFVRSQPISKHHNDIGLGPDSVLNEELVAEAQSA